MWKRATETERFLPTFSTHISGIASGGAKTFHPARCDKTYVAPDSRKNKKIDGAKALVLWASRTSIVRNTCERLTRNSIPV